ncbi:MAG: carboxypeptidase-like regulatory domain-containing protein [Bacteroidota bacterium]
MNTPSKLLLSCFLFFFLISLFNSTLQAQLIIQARVVDAQTEQALAYATVASISSQDGTLTNADGFFSLEVSSAQDSLTISFLGYQSMRLQAGSLRATPVVLLQPQSIELSDVTVFSEDEYLYRAVSDCRKTLRRAPNASSRAYLQLVTNSTEQPVELIQAYYNLDLSQRRIDNFRLKNGRVAMALQDSMFFVNLSTTQALTQLDLYQSSGAFNRLPLHFNLRALRKKFELRRLASLSNPDLYHIAFNPREEGQALFSGELWIDKNSFQLHKLVIRDEAVEEHPFFSVFPNKRIERLGLELRYTFKEVPTGMQLSHIEWAYEVQLVPVSAAAQRGGLSLVQTEGILHCYDYRSTFWEPFFDYDPQHNDYRKISFLPYNPDFWSSSHGLVYTEQQLEQMAFFRDHGFLINHFDPSSDKEGFFEFNNPHWQADYRSFYQEPQVPIPPPTDQVELRLNAPSLPGFGQQQEEEIAVQIFLDLNRLGDSIQFTSVTVLDLYQTISQPPYDSLDHCLLNMYFDLCEIERRKMMEKLRGVNDYQQAAAIHATTKTELERLQRSFFREVRGLKPEQMLRKWNYLIYRELGIDNLALFKIEG